MNAGRMTHLAFVLVGLFFVASPAPAQKPAAKKGAKSTAPTYYKLTPGEFPAEGSATAIGGELIAVDRVARTGHFRLDRTDAQNRAWWDLPLPFTMLPYGSVWYHGAPAELRDIPLGTHLVGQFYWDEAIAESPKTKELFVERQIPQDNGFHWVLRFEDDFSDFRRRGRVWRIDAIDRDKQTLTATGVGEGGEAPDPRPSIFQVNEAVRVWKGNGFGELADLKAGDRVLMNFTQRTMKLSGRCLDIWLDEESRRRASDRQLAAHRVYAREHGLFGRIDAVDDKTSTLAVTMFDGFDPRLKADFDKEATYRNAVMPPFAFVAVAEESRGTYDAVNDVKRAPILEMKAVPAAPGGSGWQVVCRPELMIEGFRLKRIVSLRAGTWGVADLPKEEKLFFR